MGAGNGIVGPATPSAFVGSFSSPLYSAPYRRQSRGRVRRELSVCRMAVRAPAAPLDHRTRQPRRGGRPSREPHRRRCDEPGPRRAYYPPKRSLTPACPQTVRRLVQLRQPEGGYPGDDPRTVFQFQRRGLFPPTRFPRKHRQKLVSNCLLLLGLDINTPNSLPISSYRPTTTES